MQDAIPLQRIPGLADTGNVIPEGYKYYKKKITPGVLLNIKGASLKWYNIYPADLGITQEQLVEARRFLETEAEEGRIKMDGELGFVMLHRTDEYLLILLTTWRYTNEMWESVFLKKAGELESYKPLKFINDHKGTYCVWELGAVCHEKNAWVRFIESKRDEEAKLHYLNDLFEGEV